jgi:hypothetical protein
MRRLLFLIPLTASTVIAALIGSMVELPLENRGKAIVLLIVVAMYSVFATWTCPTKKG